VDYRQIWHYHFNRYKFLAVAKLEHATSAGMKEGRDLRLWVAQVVVWAMYLFFALATRLPARNLGDPAAALEANGFRLISEVSRLRGFLSSRLGASLETLFSKW
jgi:hypothetical protein